MKMKTLFSKRRFLAALTAALLISAALIASCMTQLEDQNDKVVIPEGKGIVRIKLNSARTILPTSLPDPSTLKYTVEMFNGTTTTKIPASGTNAVDFGDVDGEPIVLATGTYRFTITAWDDVDTSDPGVTANPIAGWTKSGIAVNASESLSLIANLIGWTDSGEGTFEYTILVPAISGISGFSITDKPLVYSTKTIEIFEMDGTTLVTMDTHGSPISTNLANTGPSANTDTIDLPAGFYRVKVTLAADACQTRVVEQVLHVYNTQESIWPSFTVPPLSQNKFTVTFDFVKTPSNVGSFTLTPQDGLSNADIVTSPGSATPTLSNWVFEYWQTATNKRWYFADETTPSIVLADTALFGKWTSSAGVTVSIIWSTPNITITPVYNDGTLDVGSLSYDDLVDPLGSASITITATLSGDYAGEKIDSIDWKLDGVVIKHVAAGNNSPTAILKIDNTFTNFSLLTMGAHSISAEFKLVDSPGTWTTNSGTLTIAAP